MDVSLYLFHYASFWGSAQHQKIWVHAVEYTKGWIWSLGGVSTQLVLPHLAWRCQILLFERAPYYRRAWPKKHLKVVKGCFFFFALCAVIA